MLTQVEFRSDRFPANAGEERQINPGVLAEFVRDNLRNEGFEIEELTAEDGGWMVPVANKHFRLWIGCARIRSTRTVFSVALNRTHPLSESC